MIDAAGKLTKKHLDNSLKGDVPLSPTVNQPNGAGSQSIYLKALKPE